MTLRLRLAGGGDPAAELEEHTRTSWNTFANLIDYSMRTVLPETGAGLTRNIAQIRVTFDGTNCSENGEIDNASVAIRSSGSTALQFDRAGRDMTLGETELLFSAGSGFTLTAGGEVVSDWMDFAANIGDELFVICDMGSNGAADQIALESAAAYQSYWKSAANTYNTTTMPATPSDLSGDNIGISKIETRNWPS